jgi:hypothetical protein
MALKFSLIANVVEKVDFSEMDLESPYYYTERAVTYDQNRNTKEYDCEVRYDLEEHTVRKNGKIVKVIKGTDFKYSANNPAGCLTDIAQSSFPNYVDVITYLAPSKKEFKDSLVKTLRSYKFKNPIEALNSERVFKLENDGFTIWNKGELSYSLHATKAINADIIFLEDLSTGEYIFNDNMGALTEETVTEFTQINSVYIGSYSYLKRFSDLPRTTVIYNETTKGPTVEELLKTL